MPRRRAETNDAQVRRTHRKSRNGCLECKRRHIKCDEARPACSNCSISDRTCSFPPPRAVPTRSRTAQAEAETETQIEPRSQTQSRVQSPTESVSKSNVVRLPPDEPFMPFSMSFDEDPVPQILPNFADTLAPSPASSHQDPLYTHTFTAKHMILLHHVQTSDDMFTLGPDLKSPMVDLTLSWAVEAPYALDQLLAMSADHFALKNPENAASHRRTATELQTRGLIMFNQVVNNLSNEDPKKTCIPRFLFAALLSIHAMYETFAYYRASFHVFIDRFTESINLHRGVRATMSSTYEIIAESPLSRYFNEIKEASERNQGTECDQLQKFIQSSDLGPAALAGCTQAVERLQWAFNIQASLPPIGKGRAGTAWPVVLTSEFVDALRKRQPEGLVILAYYGVLLHRCRDSWIFGDAGAFLIRLVSDYLGNFWQEPMQWPLAALELDDG